MNTKPIRLTTAILAATAATALLVTGCSSNSSSSSSTTTKATTAAPAGPQTSAPGNASGGSSSASVDGKPISAKFDTTCAKQGGNLALALTDQSNATYGTLTASATITGTDTVQAVGIAGTKGGANGQPYALGFGNGMPGGSATVTKSGNTYTVTGEGVGGVDMSNPMAGPKTEKFEIVFACSTVVGG
ncbi:lipoprotein LpqH [Nocardia sp. CDC153]|uniref:lipoprotein LpqH n=1 Tax=Nocardia sp. CDC153 TaxID=3112167 RepID=UPI002DB5FE14|nr:lipoprotein LpqH [Nocardia sp. CDC153]MEC3952677.1 lipoprotein LpqH [Nocardia sp. CDC153]